jgi:DNA-binding SARP family transcriptional activator
MTKRPWALVAGLTAAALAALIWTVRPPIHDLAFEPRVSRTQLETFAYLAIWTLSALLAFAGTLRAGLAVLRKPKHGTPVSAWLSDGVRHRRPRLAPLALRTRSSPTLLIAPRPLQHPENDESEASGESAGRDARRTVGEIEDVPRVHVLGPFTISGARQSRRGLRASAIEMIAYLALHRQGASRDELLEALWPGDDPRKSRSRLYQATRDARRLLGDTAISTAHDRYLLDRTHAHIDLDELEATLSQLGQVESRPERNRLLEKAVALFADQPLAGFDYPWAQGELRRLLAVQVDLLAELGQALIFEGDARAALDTAERGIKLDPLNEELWRTALEAEASLGMRSAVEDRYGILQTLLDERLGLEPDGETRALYRQLLGQT